MEEQATMVVAEASTEYVGRWNRLVSTTNWEKGRIISEWRRALEEAGSPNSDYTDEAWSRQVGNVTPQHVGRLRRVYDRFGASHEQYAGLFWSHFQAAMEWPDAEMYLEGAVQNGWSISQMRNQRWEALGGDPLQKPSDADIVSGELDEDVSAGDASLPSAVSETMGEVRDVDEEDESEEAPFDADAPIASESSEMTAETETAPSAPLMRPFESLPPMPADLKEAFELFKLAILSHKVLGWSEFSQDDILAVIESLRQLALAPAE